jgi:hypothetical protein
MTEWADRQNRMGGHWPWPAKSMEIAPVVAQRMKTNPVLEYSGRVIVGPNWTFGSVVADA